MDFAKDGLEHRGSRIGDVELEVRARDVRAPFRHIDGGGNGRERGDGGAGGIGKAAAELFTLLGARVVVADVEARSASEAAAETQAVGFQVGDVSVEADAIRMVDGAADQLGGLDAVFHCAGIHKLAPAMAQQISDWQRVMDVNVRGTQFVCSLAAKHMAPHRAGAMVVVTSIAGYNGQPRRSAYGTSKAAVAYLARCFATEWGHLGIRVNAIAPGYVLTPMARGIIESGATDAARIIGRTPLGRLAEPVEIARAAAFLLSSWSSYITGAELFVDGGWAAYGGSGEVNSF